MQLEGRKILVTGPAGQIAFPLASRLARDNEVWGIARFRDADSRDRCEKAGIATRVVDLADPDWGDLPDDFDYLLHLAAAIVPGHDFDSALRINAEGTGRVMSRFRGARACLMMSTCGDPPVPARCHPPHPAGRAVSCELARRRAAHARGASPRGAGPRLTRLGVVVETGSRNWPSVVEFRRSARHVVRERWKSVIRVTLGEWHADCFFNPACRGRTFSWVWCCCCLPPRRAQPVLPRRVPNPRPSWDCCRPVSCSAP
jgi:nucleoside-diphosphate-sugar epimerase